MPPFNDFAEAKFVNFMFMEKLPSVLIFSVSTFLSGWLKSGLIHLDSV